ncbi:MAG: M16 family metallopeptidase [Blastocatellia bacterium]
MRDSIRAARQLFLLAMLLCLSLAAAAAQATAPAQAPASDATSDFTLANGLKAIHRRVPANDVVAVQIYFRGGTRNITEKNAGVESLMFDVAQQGTKNFSKGEINRELARMGTVMDSGSGNDFSVFAMRCVKQNFDRSWQLLADMILNPTFDEKEITLARDQVINGLRQQNDNPESQVAILSNKLLYKSHPYFNSPDGTVESLSKLTAADLRAHHASILAGSRMLVLLVGNVMVDDARRKIEASFGRVPRGDYRIEAPPVFSTAETPVFELVEKGVATNYIRGTFAAPPLNHPDYPAFSVAVNILTQLFFQEVRVKRNLTYGADATLLSNGANSGFISVTTPKPNETIRVMFDQIDFLQRQVILKEPLQSIISGFLTQYYTKLETNDAQAAKLAEYELAGGNWRKLVSWIDEVNKVTPEDINRVSLLYLKNFHFAAIGDPKQFNRDLFLSR